MRIAIEKTRNLYEKKKSKISIINIFKDKLFMPLCVKGNIEGGLAIIYKDASILYKEGIVANSCLVQANELLFKKGIFDCPACVLFSTDKYYDDNIEELETIATQLYSYKDVENAPNNIRRFTDAITDEHSTLLNVKLPDEITNGRAVYYTSIVVHRKHIPDRYLKHRYVPLLVAPNKTKASIILPKHYWSEEMLDVWNS